MPCNATHPLIEGNTRMFIYPECYLSGTHNISSLLTPVLWLYPVMMLLFVILFATLFLEEEEVMLQQFVYCRMTSFSFSSLLLLCWMVTLLYQVSRFFLLVLVLLAYKVTLCSCDKSWRWEEGISRNCSRNKKGVFCIKPNYSLGTGAK